MWSDVCPSPQALSALLQADSSLRGVHSSSGDSFRTTPTASASSSSLLHRCTQRRRNDAPGASWTPACRSREICRGCGSGPAGRGTAARAWSGTPGHVHAVVWRPLYRLGWRRRLTLPDRARALCRGRQRLPGLARLPPWPTPKAAVSLQGGCTCGLSVGLERFAGDGSGSLSSRGSLLGLQVSTL